MSQMESQKRVTLIHFNDVYDIESQKKEPVGGAARFATAIKSFAHLDPIVLFSGDCFAPSMLSTVTKGKQMVEVLNAVKTTCAVYGNHDFDFGVDVLEDLVKKTRFPWLMSNVINNETGAPLGDGLRTWTLEKNNIKIGFVNILIKQYFILHAILESEEIGLVEWEWLETLSTIDPDEVTFTNYVEAGDKLAAQLKQEGCKLIIALTHMRFPNDIHLAENVKGIDLILGGHDHVYDLKEVNGIPVLKSGTDFRDFSLITVHLEGEKPKFKFDRISVTSDYEEDVQLKNDLTQYTDMITTKLDEELGEFHVDLEGRFTEVRTKESNLGNFLSDIMVACTNADCAILNSGTIRSDRVHPAGKFTLRDLLTILPMMDSFILLSVTGAQLIDALENGVSQYPKLEGRFPQVAGIRFAFDPSKPPGNRIDPKFVQVADEYIQVHQVYRLVTKQYLGTGHDGYTVLANAPVLADEDECLHLTIAVQNHLHAIKMVQGETRRSSRHHQSLVTVSRRHSLLRSVTSTHDLSPSPIGFDRGTSLSPRPSLSRQGNVVEDLERTTCKLAPIVEGRIVIIQNKDVYFKLVNERKDWEANKRIVEEDENSPTSPNEVLQRLRRLHSAAISASSTSRDSGISNSTSGNVSPSSPHHG